MKHFAKKTPCNNGHVHASGKEARRCNDLHLLQSGGKITGLQQQPVLRFVIDGRAVKMGNGQDAKLTADFSYVENGKKVIEDSKPKERWAVSRDFAFRWALARTLWPDIEFRVVS